LWFFVVFKSPNQFCAFTVVNEADSELVKDVKVAYNDYCKWISRGAPSQAWSYVGSYFSGTGKTLMERARDNEVELSEIQLEIAKALSADTRFKALMALQKDPPTAYARLSVFKAAQELFFGDQFEEESAQIILSRSINKELEDA
jgi:hypothetical protein